MNRCYLGDDSELNSGVKDWSACERKRWLAISGIIAFVAMFCFPSRSLAIDIGGLVTHEAERGPMMFSKYVVIFNFPPEVGAIITRSRHSNIMVEPQRFARHNNGFYRSICPGEPSYILASHRRANPHSRVLRHGFTKVLNNDLPGIRGCSSIRSSIPKDMILGNSHISPQFLFGSAFGLSDQLVSSAPKPKSEQSDKYFRTVIKPPIRIALLFSICVAGWCLIFLSGKYFDNHRRLLGSALAVGGFFLWGFSFVIWFISRYEWSWRFPI